MMTRSLLVLACVGCTSGAPEPSVDQPVEAASALDGAWAVAEVTTNGPDSATLNIRAPQPGLILFTGRHYSLVRVNTAEARPDLPPADSATVEQLLAVYGNAFTAQAGTYEMAGTTVSFMPLVAKNPAVMAPGRRFSAEVQLQGDSVWVTPLPADTAAAANPNLLTVKYVRVR